MLARLLYTIWVLLNGNIIIVLATCVKNSESSHKLTTTSIYCIDSNAEDFVYITNVVKTHKEDLPISECSELEKVHITLENVSIANTFIINELKEMSESEGLNVEKVRAVNNLTDLDVEHLISRLPKLNALDVSDNQLTRLPDITVDSHLEYLYLPHNNINHLYQVYDLKKLLVLDISFCNISFIQKEAFGGYNGILKTLNLSNNKIKTLNFALNKVCGLEVLDLSYNLLEHLRKSDLCRSSFINLQGNKLITTTFDFQPSHFTGLSLDVLRIGNLANVSMNLDMQFHPYKNGGYEIEKLEVLADTDVLPSDAFQPHPKYKYKNKSHFILRDISLSEIVANAFRGLNDEQTLLLDYNNLNILQSYIFNDSKLSLVDLSSSNISSIEANAFFGTFIGKILLSNNDLTELNPNVFCNTHVNEIDLSYNNLERLEYLACENYIKKLDLQFNYITTIDNMGIFFELTHLNVSFNKISKLSENFGQSLPSLEFLDLSHNLITELADNTFVPLKKLRFLSLEHNILTKIDPTAFTYDALDLESLVITYDGVVDTRQFSRLARLKNLTFSDSRITLLKNKGFMGLVRLTSLFFINVTIEKIVTGCFSGLVSLQEADFSNILKAQTFLISGFFEGLDSLTSLNISGTDLKMIQHNAFSGVPSLVTLFLSHNNISSLETGSFSGLNHLESLYLDHNQLHDLNIGIFSSTKNLTVLDLSFNSLQVLRNNVMFPIMESLRYLNLEGNKLMELDHIELIKINRGELYINLSNNLWKCHYLFQLLGNFTLGNIGYRVTTNVMTDRENIDGIYCIDICKFVYCQNFVDEYQQ